jgi:hypothetical protein
MRSRRQPPRPRCRRPGILLLHYPQGEGADKFFRDLIDMSVDAAITERQGTVRLHRRAYLVLASDLIDKSLAVLWCDGLPLRFDE